MNVKPIDSLLKARVKELIAAGMEKAAEHHLQLMARCDGLSHFKRSKIIIEEEERIDKIEAESEYPFYVQNYSSDDTLLSQFSNRAFLLGVDESEAILNAVYIGRYNLLIMEERRLLKEDIPPYSYQQFLKGIDCPYFMTFKDYYKVERDDYYKIRNWQAQSMIRIIIHESNAQIKRLQDYCKTLVDPLAFLAHESHLIEENLMKTKAEATEIKKVLCQLYILQDHDIDKYDNRLLEEQFIVFLGDAISYKNISTNSLKKPLRLLSRAKATVISNEYTIFLMINTVADWLEKVLQGKSWKEEVQQPDHAAILRQTLEQANSQVLELEKEMESIAYDPNKSKEEVLSYLVSELEKYRVRFNNHREKYFFHVLKDEMKDVLEKTFTTNCFFSLDLEGQVKALTEAVIIQEMSWKTVQVHYDIFETHRMPLPDDDVNHYEIMTLLHKMVLTKADYNEFSDCLSDFMYHFHNYLLPMEIHFQNSRETMENIFHKCMGRMTEILDEAEPSAKTLYLQTRLKQLRHRELEWKQFEKKEYFDKKELRFNGLFKEFLQIEEEFIKQTKELAVHLPLLENGSTKTLTQQANFDSAFTPERGAFILSLMEDLGITVNGISALSERKKGALRGLVDALRENNLAPGQSIETLCNMLAQKTGLTLQSTLDVSKTSEQIRKKANTLIKGVNKP